MPTNTMVYQILGRDLISLLEAFLADLSMALPLTTAPRVLNSVSSIDR